METEPIDGCHQGTGKLDCSKVLGRGDCTIGLKFMHDDVLEPGATIGEHPHLDGEEVYFIVEGTGKMILDGTEYPVGPGDVCVCARGHSHGLFNSDRDRMRLLVISLHPSIQG